MARVSDVIEEFIKQMLMQSQDNFLEIQRNELANTFKCAPSQINYVLTTRFTVDRGYYIESRRGGGGSIKITRIEIDKNDYLKELIFQNIGEQVSQQDAEAYIDLFLERKFISEREAVLMKSVVNDKTLTQAGEAKDSLRAHILKTMLITMID